tara:strand:+ start:295 stop:639 length:345 start_codon:yes stop_codon:yes gene_type:complete
MNIKIQTMELDLTTPSLIYTKPSKIWEINKKKLIQFDYFNKLFNLFNFNQKNIYLVNDISDEEMILLLDYINNIDNYNVKNLDLNQIMLLIKISDFLIIPELFKISTKEFFNRL